MTDVFYEKKNDHVVITGGIPGSMVIAVPKEIEGLPVTEIAAHAFEGSACPVFHLPDSISRIGEYAFHDCQGLEEFVLPSSLRELGAYAFYDCHHLKHFLMSDSIRVIDHNSLLGCDGLTQITMEIREGRHQSLKPILSELFQELEVEFRYLDSEQKLADRALIVFPEYFVEYVELAEARVFEEFTIGSGRVYRKFFQEPDFDYAAYDKHFAIACLKDLAPQAGRVAVARLMVPYRLSESAASHYLQWLRDHAEEACLQYVEREDLDTLHFLKARGVIGAHNIDLFLDEAVSRQKRSVLSWLMQLKGQYFKKEEKTFDL